jgi:hypothetical protein
MKKKINMDKMPQNYKELIRTISIDILSIIGLMATILICLCIKYTKINIFQKLIYFLLTAFMHHFHK